MKSSNYDKLRIHVKFIKDTYDVYNFSHGHRQRRAVSFRLRLTQGGGGREEGGTLREAAPQEKAQK